MPAPRKRPCLWLEPLEDRTLLSIVLNNGALLVNCDTPTELQGGNQVNLGTDAGGNIFAEITDKYGNVENGSFDPATVSHIYADGCAAGSDTFNISQTLASAPVTVNYFANSGGPNEVANVVTSLFFGENIQGTVDIYDPHGSIAVNAVDQRQFPSTIYLFTFTYPDDRRLLGAIRGLVAADIHYDYAQTSKVNLETSISMILGEYVNVEATGTTTNLVFNGNGASVTVSAEGSVQDIQGTLNVESPSLRPTFLVIDNSADPTPRSVTLGTFINPSDSEGNNDPWGYIHGLAPAAINYEHQDMSSVTVKTGDGMLKVQATGAPTNLIGNGQTIVDVGDAGSVQGILGPLYVANSQPGGTTLKIDGSLDTVTETVTLASSGPSTPLTEIIAILISHPSPTAVQISFDSPSTASVTVCSSNVSGDEINVLAAAVPTYLRLNGMGTVDVGGGSLQALAAPLDIRDSQQGGAQINVDDSAETIQETVMLSGFPGSNGPVTEIIAILAGVPLPPINVENAGTSSLTLATSSAAGDVIDVLGTGVTTNLFPPEPVIVNVGAGNVQRIQGTLTIMDGQPGGATINVDDSADLNPENVTLATVLSPSGAPCGSITGLAPAAIKYLYAGTSSLTLSTGPSTALRISVGLLR
jgi:hypothetical protein